MCNRWTRYVSQNVSYTSAIILKRAVKAKLDLGILLMTCLYLPVLYTLVQAVTCKSPERMQLITRGCFTPLLVCITHYAQ